MKPVSNFTDRFKIAFGTRNVTEFAESIGVSKQTISAYLNGTRKPKHYVAVAIAKKLGVNAMWIEGYDVPMDENVEAYASAAKVLKNEVEIIQCIKDVFGSNASDAFKQYLALGQCQRSKSFQYMCSLEGVTLDITKHNALDDHGKKMVDFTLCEEYERIVSTSVDEEAQTIEIKLCNMPVSAGTGDYLSEDGFEYFTAPKSELAQQADYAIRVDGDSMEPTYCDGDRVLVQACECIDNGKIGIFCVNGKGYIKEKQDGWLVSKNPDRDDIRLHENDGTRCFGLVVGTA